MDPHSLANLAPHPGRIVVVDTWAGTGLLDVSALAEAGVSAVIAKCTDGLHLENPAHAVDAHWLSTSRAVLDHQVLLGDAGMVLLPYCVLEPHTDPAGQARRALDLLRDVYATTGARIGPVSCDFELAANETGAEALHAARVWTDTAGDELGRPCMLYTMPSFWEYLVKIAGPAGMDDVAALSALPLWLAHYTGSYDRAPHVPAQWTEAALWQASGGRKVSRNYAALPWNPAIDIDVSLFPGTVDELVALDL